MATWDITKIQGDWKVTFTQNGEKADLGRSDPSEVSFQALTDWISDAAGFGDLVLYNGRLLYQKFPEQRV